MKYSLSNLTFGKKIADTICNFETQSPVRDMCSTVDENILLVTKGSLLSLSTNKSEISRLLASDGLEMNSIAYNPEVRGCALIEGMGSRIRFLDPKAINVRAVTGNASRGNAMFRRAREKLGDVANISSIMTSVGGVYFTNSALNKGFYMYEGNTVPWIGTGKTEYCVGSRLQACGINKPNDMLFYGYTIILADTGNHCIRRCDQNGLVTISGNSMVNQKNDGCEEATFCSPRLLSESKGILYIMDGDSLRYYSFGNKSVGTIGEFPNVVGVAMGQDRSLFMLSEMEGENNAL